MEWYDWKILLKKLGFKEKSKEEANRNASYYIMKKGRFEVEYSTGHLWENERKYQTSISDYYDLDNRYYLKTGKHLK